MSFAVGFSLSDITPPACLDRVRNINNHPLVVRPSFGSLHRLNKKANIIKVLSDHDSRELLVSPDIVPGIHLGRKKITQKMEFIRTLLIDNYDSYTYNLFQELSVINGVPPVVVRNDEWSWEDAYHYLFEENAFDNIVISPGPGSPACPTDIGICLKLFQECRDIPILGVCLGHQALGYVYGAQIIHAPEPIHGRLSEIDHNGCRLFHNIPSGTDSGFKVVRYHSLVVDVESLPEELIPIAWTSSGPLSFLGAKTSNVNKQLSFGSLLRNFSEDSFVPKQCNGSQEESTRKVLMGIMHSTRPHYGLQFHPESIGTSHGRQIFQNFRKITEDYWLSGDCRPAVKEKPHRNACIQVPHERWGCKDAVLKCQQQEKHLTKQNRGVNGNRFLNLRFRKFDQLAKLVGGSKRIFCELFGDHKAENTFWLDSSSVEKGRARFSFMGGKGGSLWKQITFRLSDQSDDTFKSGGNLVIEDAQGFTSSIYLKDGFFDFLNKDLQSISFEPSDYEGLPFNFYGGYVGYIGYDLKLECGMISNRHKSTAPDASLFFSDNLIVVDHLNDDVYILSLQDSSETAQEDWLDAIQLKLLRLKDSFLSSSLSSSELLSSTTPPPPPRTPSEVGFTLDKSREEYIKDVEKCQKYIKDGESYEVCFTTQMRKQIGEETDSLGLYLNLREKNPAPYAAWLNFSKEKLCVCSSSPERFLKLDKNGVLEAKPIKGTISRGSTSVEDELMKFKLQYSEKDQAENLMIVDLLRNDLGRVCEAGSVHVPNLMEVESYATVHTMVSTIRGKKKSNTSAVECVRAAFPGGSMTGAPKLRTMQLLDSLESRSRGIYSGCIGYFSYNQTIDLNIVIRTIVIHQGEASIGAGGAVVALSTPEDEYNEMLLKTRAPLTAIREFEGKNEL